VRSTPARHFGRLFRSLQETLGERIDRRERIHYLHIGKNAGNQIKHLAELVDRSDVTYRFRMHPHLVTLADLPTDARYFFSIRSPITRFKSAFYSRKRMGRPLNDYPWTDLERRAFDRFEHAEDLAANLFAEGRDGHDAMCAIKSIGHCTNDQVSWFTGNMYCLDIRPPVWILRMESLEEDIDAMLSRLGGEVRFEPCKDAVVSHRMDYSGIPELSEHSKRNLERWYAQDMEFYRRCEGWIMDQEGS